MKMAEKKCAKFFIKNMATYLRGAIKRSLMKRFLEGRAGHPTAGEPTELAMVHLAQPFH